MRLVKKASDILPTKEDKKYLCDKYKLIPEIIDLLYLRNINNIQKIDKFLNPSINDFYDPFLINGMDKAVSRINEAIKNNENILIFGDYDVDGISAIAILKKHFFSLNYKVDHFTPNRFIDGYGLTNESLDKVIGLYNPKLIITVDCGISCYKEVEYAKSKQVDVIITDHHDIPEILPDTIVLNAKCNNQEYPFKEICGTGMAFKLVHALSNLKTACIYLPIVAIATIADIVPLIDENRAMVYLGLKDMKNAPKGILKLFDRLGLTKINANEISFKIAPKLNASGRLGDANTSLKLYLEEDDKKIDEIIDEILSLNTQRQDMCNQIYDECIEMLDKQNLADKRVIILYNENWDVGVLGIIASRLTEEFYRPSFLFSSVDNGMISGSGRSIYSINIHSALTKLSDILESFGGHTMAAGLKLKYENLELFNERIEKVMKQDYKSELFIPKKPFDIDINVNMINKAFVKQLEFLEPFGNENPKPKFRVTIAKTWTTLMKNYPKHLTINLSNTQAVGFNLGQYYDLMNQCTLKEAIIEVQMNLYHGIETHKIFFKDIIPAKTLNIENKDRLYGDILLNLKYGFETPQNIEFFDFLDLKNIFNKINDVYGNLFITYSEKTYNFISNNPLFTPKIVNYQLHDILENKGHNTLVINPNIENNFNNFKNIIFVDYPISFGLISKLSEKTHARILVNNKPYHYPFLLDIDTKRELFAQYFLAIKNILSHDDTFDNEFELFKRLKGKFNYKQFIACLLVFEELKIINHNDNVFKIDKNTNANLENSEKYKFFVNSRK